MKFYEYDQNEILWRWSKWNIMKVIKMTYYEGDLEMKYYEGDQNEILWRWSKWNIVKVIEMKYYEGDPNEIL